MNGKQLELPYTQETKKFNSMIICAAIKLESGRVIRGHRHNDCIRVAKGIPAVSKKDIIYRVEGFMNSDNEFVDRKEAKIIAVEAGQTIEDHDQFDLYSEDLY